MTAVLERPAIVMRGELHLYLRKAIWPLSPAMAANAARHQGAPESMMAAINDVRNRQYKSEEDLWGELSKA